MKYILFFVLQFILIVSPFFCLFSQPINQDFQNGDLTGVNAIVINDPGRLEGIQFAQTMANWTIDVAPPDRNSTIGNSDGDLHLYGIANNIRVWRNMIIRGNVPSTQVKLQVANISPTGHSALRLSSNENDNSGAAILRFNQSWSSAVPMWEASSMALWEGEGAVNIGAKTNLKFYTGSNSNERLRVSENGNVSIGTAVSDSKLTVDGTITSEEIKVKDIQGADFVFSQDYELPTLQEVKVHIEKYHHLPDIPSAQEMRDKGVLLGEMNIKLLQKIEELTLYLIEQNKIILGQQESLEQLQIKINQLENHQ